MCTLFSIKLPPWRGIPESDLLQLIVCINLFPEKAAKLYWNLRFFFAQINPGGIIQ